MINCIKNIKTNIIDINEYKNIGSQIKSIQSDIESTNSKNINGAYDVVLLLHQSFLWLTHFSLQTTKCFLEQVERYKSLHYSFQEFVLSSLELLV